MLLSDLFVLLLLLQIVDAGGNLLVTVQQHRAKALRTVIRLLERGVVLVIGLSEVVIDLVVRTQKQSNGLRSLDLRLLLLRHFIVGRHTDLHGLRLTQRGTEHEERDKKHVHVHHRGEVDPNGELLLLALTRLTAAFLYFSHNS